VQPGPDGLLPELLRSKRSALSVSRSFVRPCRVALHLNRIRNPVSEFLMSSFKNTLRRVAQDDRGGETIEYALILGLIVVTAIVIITSVGTKVVARWTSVNSSL
jgi:Flp pilus assembly pilin Flp